MSLALRAVVLVLAVSTLDASPAHADAIEPPPTDCPIGSEGDSSHCGPVCRARGCVSASDCSIGETCAARSLCIRPSSCGPGSVEGECVGACASGLTCTSAFVCVPGTTPADAGRRDSGSSGDGGSSRYTTSYCGCSVPRRAPVPGWLAVLVPALFFVVRRAR